MAAPLSYAQVCAKANGVEICQVDGVNMSKELVLVIKTAGSYFVTRQQLRATQGFISACQTKQIKKEKAAKNQAEREQADKDKPFRFLDLPFDLRDIILGHIIKSQNIMAFLKNSSTPLRLPAVAYAGHMALRRHCQLVTLKKCTIEIHSGPGNAKLQSWLSKIDFSAISNLRTGFDAIRSLKFPYFSRFPYGTPGINTNNDVQLMLACKNLTTVTLNFHPGEVGRIFMRFHNRAERNNSTLYFETAQRIRQNYQLDGILGATELKTLRLDANPWGPLSELASWFTEQFLERGQEVKVEFT
ncbi:hypothetical protein Q7P37_001642 [Cladosporium fusiforme]